LKDEVKNVYRVTLSKPAVAKEITRMNAGITKDYLRSPVLDDLSNSEIHYRRLFESARDGILILDAVTGKITDANPSVM
jgi:PAS domain-containing protein